MSEKEPPPPPTSLSEIMIVSKLQLSPNLLMTVTYYFFPSSVVEVCFKESSYSVNESAGQVSVSLRITGQFFIPLHAVIEISDGTATGEPCT